MSARAGEGRRANAWAHDCVADLLAPEEYDRFFDTVVGRRMLHISEGDSESRAALAGDDPRALILEAYERFAPTLTCHAGTAKGRPPSARSVGSATEFEALVGEYHDAGYTVRIPGATDLAPRLQRLCRALDLVFEARAEAGIFWSSAGLNAPVHHDEYDIIAVQLWGRKRWFISSEPPTLPNTWHGAGEGAPRLGQHHVIDVAPGDVLYLPRGTPHTVESTTESIHASIGFVPVTLRDAIIAAVDTLSEFHQPLRTGVTDRADDLSRGRGEDQVAERVRRGLEELVEKCRADEFVRASMDRRRARMIEDLPRLKSRGAEADIRPDDRVRHHPLAAAHVLNLPHAVDFRQPGDRILMHPGAAGALQYIVDHPEFRVADLPGGLPDDVKVALVSRLVASGFLEPVSAD